MSNELTKQFGSDIFKKDICDKIDKYLNDKNSIINDLSKLVSVPSVRTKADEYIF